MDNDTETTKKDLSSALNPYAEAWLPQSLRETEEQRTLFITFSKGFPLNVGEIRNFFSWKYGDCIERIYVNNTNPAAPPLFGKVVFSGKAIADMIMSDHEQVRFRINGRALWCKRYRLRQERGPDQQHL
ncbi:hypothetical protein Nepgr_024213 [Nepenthes gracilis]|uniref:Uncharacterized protein n=1 Tax=Nepenthes gracilis TaxID=150966 RepID=A0AAD3T2P7_NEPGR|nr:hypothetical protein Nepgr_024213 [Nepenthes gracilis]